MKFLFEPLNLKHSLSDFNFDIYHKMSDDKDDLVTASNSLYEDKFCQVTKKKLIIRTYFCPTFQDKEIDICDIKNVYYKKQEACSDCFKVKDWGMALTPVWWACDFGRCFRGGEGGYYNVAVDSGSIIKKGFTVVKINDFIECLKQLIDDSKFIPNRLPSCCQCNSLLHSCCAKKD